MSLTISISEAWVILILDSKRSSCICLMRARQVTMKFSTVWGIENSSKTGTLWATPSHETMTVHGCLKWTRPAYWWLKFCHSYFEIIKFFPNLIKNDRIRSKGRLETHCSYLWVFVNLIIILKFKIGCNGGHFFYLILKSAVTGSVEKSHFFLC